MKTKIIAARLRLVIAVLLGSLTLAFVFHNAANINRSNEQLPAPPLSNNNISDEFLIGAMSNAWDINFRYIHDTLGMNVWHYYVDGNEKIGNNYYPKGWWPFGATDDILFTPNNAYTTNVRTELQTIGSHNMKALMQRPKIEYLCYGERSDYMCVDTTHIDDHNLWFYTFQSPYHVGIDVTDSHAGPGGQHYVRYCQADPTSPNGGTVVSRLRANSEQSRRDAGEYGYRCDTQHDWFIKPRIRIDSTIAHSSQNPAVCNIKVLAEDGQTPLLNVDIHANDFLVDPGRNYDGRYIEEFNFSNGDLTIHGDWGHLFYGSARGNRTTDLPNRNHADIQVYWYGNCDMWLDYVRVDNDVANDLFKGIYDNTWLQWEGEDIAKNEAAAFKFYIELFEFNQIPCMAYVSRKLDSLSGKHVDLVADQLNQYQLHIDWEERGRIMTANQIVSECVSKINSKQVFVGHYPFTATRDPGTNFTHIPYTLPLTSGSDILAGTVDQNVNNYDAWLQMTIDTASADDVMPGNSWPGNPPPDQPPLFGRYMFDMKLGNAISQAADIPLIAWVQGHQWISYPAGETEREATNEELKLVSYLPVSYGAKGLLYFQYPSFHNYSYKCLGLIDENGLPRYQNVYGQNKWQTLRDIFSLLKTWSPFIMSFDNTKTNSYIYRKADERNLLYQNSYFANLLTFFPSNGQQLNVSKITREDSRRVYRVNARVTGLFR